MLAQWHCRSCHHGVLPLLPTQCPRSLRLARWLAAPLHRGPSRSRRSLLIGRIVLPRAIVWANLPNVTKRLNCLTHLPPEAKLSQLDTIVRHSSVSCSSLLQYTSLSSRVWTFVILVFGTNWSSASLRAPFDTILGSPAKGRLGSREHKRSRSAAIKSLSVHLYHS